MGVHPADSEQDEKADYQQERSRDTDLSVLEYASHKNPHSVREFRGMPP
jgi:hypothetical protein